LTDFLEETLRAEHDGRHARTDFEEIGYLTSWSCGPPVCGHQNLDSFDFGFATDGPRKQIP